MGINSGLVTLKEQKLNKFTARGILAIHQPGWYADPETRGLYLRVFEGTDGPSRSWLYRFTSPVSGKRRAMGLGPETAPFGAPFVAPEVVKLRDVNESFSYPMPT
jgi:hypothetical protein